MNNELNFPPNFEGLILGCIDADFCKKIAKYSLESSRRDVHNVLLCTVAPFFNLKISAKIVNIFSRMNNEFSFFSFSASNFAFFLRIFYGNLSGFRDKF